MSVFGSDAADRMEELGTFLAIELGNKHLQPHVILGQSRKLARLTGMSALPSNSRRRRIAPACPIRANMYGPAALCKMDFRERRT